MRRRVALLLVVLAVTNSGCAARKTTRRVALMYGDAFLYEANREYLEYVESWQIVVRAFPGWSICDMTASYKADVAKYHPDVVLIETLGDNSPCIGAENETPRFFDRYDRELHAMSDGARGAKLVFFGPPSTFRLQEHVDRLASMARGHGFSVSDAGMLALGGPKFVLSLPCLDIDTTNYSCRNGMAKVRSPDAVHFCPTRYPTLAALLIGCPVWSSGAYRYGRAVFQAVVAAGR